MIVYYTKHITKRKAFRDKAIADYVLYISCLRFNFFIFDSMISLTYGTLPVCSIIISYCQK